MANSNKILSTLKQQLKVAGITYRDISVALNLSEASIKHMFANKRMSLERLDVICELIGIEISELSALAEADRQSITQLSLEYEKELVADIRLLLTAYNVMNHWSIDDIVAQYQISETECIEYLTRLDKMKMIELLPNNRIRLLISVNFEWHTNGPIERFFRQQVQTQYFNADFSNKDELRLVMNGIIGVESRHKLVERLNNVGDQFEELNLSDRKLPNTDRHGTTMVLAIRRWEFQAFKTLER